MTQHAVILSFQFQFSKLALRWEEYIALPYNEANHISCGCISETNKKGDALMLYSNTSNILIKLTADDDFIAISTYCRKHGRKGRFLIFKERLQRVLKEDSGTLYDSD